MDKEEIIKDFNRYMGKEEDKRIKCQRCGVSLCEAKKYISPCHCFEKTYSKHLFPKHILK